MIVFKLKEMLEKKNITRYKLQQYTDLSLRRINDYYFGKAKFIKVEELDILCKTLECKLTDIIEFKK